MKRFLRLALIAAAASLVVTSAFAQATAADDVEQAIKDFLIPFSNLEVAKFIDYFADDATVFFPAAGFSAVRVEGKANIARTFGQVFKPSGASRPVIQPQDLKVQRLGDTAIVTFHLGSDASRARRTFVLRRIESQWKIVHLHASIIS